MRPRRRVETFREYLQAQRNGKSYILFAFRWVGFAASTMKPEETEFVVDSGASMHMVSTAELETARASKSPMKVVSGNGEVHTKEEATVYVKEWDLFVTVMLLEDTLAVLSLGKLCKDHGKNYHWTSGQKPHHIKNGRKIDCNTANHVAFVVPSLPTSSSTSSSPTSPTSPTSSSQESVTLWSILQQQEVRVWVRNYKETCRLDQQKTKTQIQMTTTRKLVAWSARMATGVQARSGRWKCTETLPVLLIKRAASKSGIG